MICHTDPQLRGKHHVFNYLDYSLSLIPVAIGMTRDCAFETGFLQVKIR